VVAAGNNGRYQATNGYATVTSPGNDPYVITVGAMKTMGTPTRTDDLIASYSSKGRLAIDALPSRTLLRRQLADFARGAGSTLYNQYPGNRVPYNYYVNGGNTASSASYLTLSGTSMAAGVVSGAVADLLQMRPTAHSGSA